MDDGPIETGVLDVGGEFLPPEALNDLSSHQISMCREHLVRLEATSIEGEWVLTRIAELMPNDDRELQSIFEQIHYISDPALEARSIFVWGADNTTVKVPDSKRLDALVYKAADISLVFDPVYESQLGSVYPITKFWSYQSPPIEVPILKSERLVGGPLGVRDSPSAFRFEVDEPLEREEASSVLKSIFKLGSAGDGLRGEVSTKLLEYYQTVRGYCSDEECIDERIPLDVSLDTVWRHVSLGPSIRCTLLSDDNVEMAVDGSCDWEPYQGLSICFLNGDIVVGASERTA